MKYNFNRTIQFVVTLLCFISICGNLCAQNNYKWDKTLEPSPAIPAEFQDADAVMIYEKQMRQTYLEDNRFFSRNIIKRRIKIQTQQGLEKYARIVILKNRNMHIEQLDARTIKADGSIVDLDSKNDIKAIELSDEDDLDKKKYKVFSIPGVAVGDEIEMVCIQEGYTIEWGATVVLHNSIPVLKSDFSVEVNNKGIVILATGRNGMPEGIESKNMEGVALSWSGKELPGLYEERGNISARSLPYFIYELNIDRLYRNSYAAAPNIRSWSDLLHHYNDEVFEVRIRKDKKFNEVFEKIVSTAESDSKIHRLGAVQKYLNEVEIEKIPEGEASEGIEYFLEKKKGDFNTLIKMYKSILEKMEIEFYFAAGRSKYLGPIDLGFPTYLQISDFLFLIPDAAGNSIVMPTKSQDNSYGLNEIPLALYDTDIYMISPTDKELFLTVSLDDQGYKKNLRLRKVKGTVQLDKGSISYAATETYSGAFSTRNRNNHYDWMQSQSMNDYLEHHLKDQEVVNVDTAFLSKRPEKDPYRYQLHYDYQISNQISKLEDKVYAISIKNLLDHYVQKASVNRMLDYYAPYGYIDEFLYYFEFDQPIKLSNKENLDINVKNELGTYKMVVNQVSPTTLIIKSKYTLTKNTIPVSEIQTLVDLMDGAEKGDNEGIIIELE